MKLNKIALGVALVAGAATVQAADTLFFPYVVSGGSVTTLVSVINTDTGGPAGAQYYNHNGSGAPASYSNTHRYLHWRYHIKTANTNEATCIENDGYFPTSPLDMVTYDVSGTRGEGGVMFNDGSVRNNWKAEGDLNQLNAITLNGERATLLVHNAAGVETPSLVGEALIVEFDTGSAWGYGAAHKNNGGESDDDDFDFSTADGFDFDGIGAVDTAVTFLPQGEFTTRFFVTPVGQLASAHGLDADNFGGFRTQVNLDTVTGSIRVVDRDESGVSGGVIPQQVTCVGVVNVRDLVVGANVWNYVSNEGGWGRLVTEAPTGTAPTGITHTANAAVIKLDFRPAGANGALNLAPGVGAMNSAYALNF